MPQWGKWLFMCFKREASHPAKRPQPTPKLDCWYYQVRSKSTKRKSVAEKIHSSWKGERWTSPVWSFEVWNFEMFSAFYCTAWIPKRLIRWDCVWEFMAANECDESDCLVRLLSALQQSIWNWKVICGCHLSRGTVRWWEKNDFYNFEGNSEWNIFYSWVDHRVICWVWHDLIARVQQRQCNSTVGCQNF